MNVSRKIENFDSHSTFNEIPENDYPAQRKRLLEALSYIEKNLEDNWNGTESVKPSAHSINMAKHFVSYLFLSKVHADFVQPDGDGGLILKWDNDDKILLLTIDGTALHMSYSGNLSEPVFVDDIPFFDVTNTILPKEILELIPNRR